MAEDGNFPNEVELGGERWKLYLPAPALKEFERLTGVNWMRTDDSSITHMNAWLYVGIKYALPKGSRPPSLDEICEWMTDMDWEAVQSVVGEVLLNSIPSLAKMAKRQKKTASR